MSLFASVQCLVLCSFNVTPFSASGPCGGGCWGALDATKKVTLCIQFVLLAFSSYLCLRACNQQEMLSRALFSCCLFMYASLTVFVIAFISTDFVIFCFCFVHWRIFTTLLSVVRLGAKMDWLGLEVKRSHRQKYYLRGLILQDFYVHWWMISKWLELYWACYCGIWFWVIRVD